MEMFASEIELQNEYQAVLVRSGQVGTIESVEYPPPAEDVYFVSAEDVKGKNEVSLFDHVMPIFASDKVEYVGQVVGVVVAKSEKEAREFASNVKIHLQEEKVVTLDLGSARLEAVLQEYKDRIIFDKCKVSEGDEDFFANGFFKSECLQKESLVSESVKTENVSLQEASQEALQEAPEPQVQKDEGAEGTASENAEKNVMSLSGQMSRAEEQNGEDSVPLVASFLHFSQRLHYHAEPLTIKVRSKQNGLDIYVATQWAYHVQKTIAIAIGENREKVKVNPTNESYSLNARIWTPSLFASMIAVASNVLKKNISLTFSFEEAISFFTRSPQIAIRHKSELSQDKKLKAMSVLCVIDAGAFNLLLHEMALHMLITSLSFYRVPSYSIRVVAIRTNTHLTDLFIGWGEHYTNTAMENHINDIVESFSLNPVQFRLEHVLRQQEKTLTGAVRKEDYKIEAIAEKVTRKTTFMRKYAAYRAFNTGQSNRHENYCRGIGMAFALQYNGLKNVVKDEIAYSVEMTLTSDEELLIKAEPSMSLLKEILKKRCVKVLNIPSSKIIFEPVKNMEPSSIGPSLPSCVSCILPLLVDRALAELQKQRFRNPLPITVQKEYKTTGRSGWDDEKCEGQPFISETAGCCVAELVLERSTYNVKVQNINIAVEAAEVIDKDYVVATVNRAVAMALSGVLREKILPCYKNASCYTLITPNEMPKIEVEVIPSKGDGLKGVSNLALNLVPQAVISALNQILHKEHIVHLPITQQDIFCLLEDDEVLKEDEAREEDKCEDEGAEVLNGERETEEVLEERAESLEVEEEKEE